MERAAHLDSFGLRSTPFQGSDHHHLSEAHRRTYDRLGDAVLEHGGLTALVGPAGVGKTAMVRRLAASLPDDIQTAYLESAPGAVRELYRDLFHDLGLWEDVDSLQRCRHALQQHLLSRSGRNGYYVLLIVDEADRLNEDTLREIRSLTPLEPWLQVLLVGRPELVNLVMECGVDGLGHSFHAAFQLLPLAVEETAEFVREHLLAAGAGDPDIFDPDALDALQRATEGIPGRIVELADRALVVAYGRGASRVTLETVELAGGMKKRALQQREAPHYEPLTPGRRIVAVQGELPGGDADLSKLSAAASAASGSAGSAAPDSGAPDSGAPDARQPSMSAARSSTSGGTWWAQSGGAALALKPEREPGSRDGRETPARPAAASPARIGSRGRGRRGDEVTPMPRELLAVANDPYGLAAEQFRVLRLRVERWIERDGGGPRAVMISSAAAGEGKSVVAANLALAFAGSEDVRTCLVDGDLRRPQIHGVFGLPCRPGLADTLAGREPLDRCIYEISEPGLAVVPSGRPGNPRDLMNPDRIARIIHELKSSFDVIVFDTPPLEAMVDARSIAAVADGVVLAVRASRSRYPKVENCLEFVDRRKLLGAVLTNVVGDMERTYARYSTPRRR